MAAPGRAATGTLGGIGGDNILAGSSFKLSNGAGPVLDISIFGQNGADGSNWNGSYSTGGESFQGGGVKMPYTGANGSGSGANNLSTSGPNGIMPPG